MKLERREQLTRDIRDFIQGGCDGTWVNVFDSSEYVFVGDLIRPYPHIHSTLKTFRNKKELVFLVVLQKMR